ncbi:imidazoleglycerol-phosphate dehydratase HisB [bacterium]|nr:imidazoleglycerol-phosphate dehydratase HisB [bacterium]
MKRSSNISRKTNETSIDLNFGIDGTGSADIKTGIGFLDHMLTLWSTHGKFDLTILATGDLHIDAHHTVEDIGICLGQAFRTALGTATGINRYASKTVPMDEALIEVAVDISNRIHLSFDVDLPKSKIGEFDTELIEEFLLAFVSNAKITLHLNLKKGRNLHHISESIFKGLGLTLDEATKIDQRITGQVPSTKGVL